MHLPSLASTLLLSRAVDPVKDRPDFSKDAIPPYPPLNNADGSSISIENLRGTRLYGWKGCSRPDAQSIAEAFNDFNKLASPLASGIDWASEVAEDFWGKNAGPNRVPDDRRKQIQQIFQAQQQMYAIGWHALPPYWTSLWIEVRCSGGDETGDPENICRDKKPEPNDQHGCGVGGEPVHDAENKLEAYSDSTYKDKSLTYSRITFCKDFFNMPSLSEAMDRNANKPPKAKEQLESWNNRARVFLHETTHLDYFMNAPGSSPLVDDLQFDWRQPGVGVTRDWAYGPKFCKILRNYGLQSESGKYPQRNADSYAWFALGSYVQSKTGTYPRQPRPRQVPKADPYNSGGGDVQASGVAALNKAQPDADLVSDSTFDAYQYANGFSTPGCPDNKIATKASVGASPPISSTGPSPAPPAADKNVCHGVSGDTWVVSRDVAANNVKDFCGQTDHTKKYNVGSDNELELSVKSLSDASKSPKDTPDCVGRFTRAILDGCDGNDKVNNPRNYKYGGTFTSGDGWEYKMTPLAKKTNGVTCDVNYKFFYDEFEIRGRYWPDAKLGIDGQGLLDKLRVCGVVSDWLFKPTPDDCCMQWYAYGKLPIGTRSCVGSAVVAAGGANSGSCNGAG